RLGLLAVSAVFGLLALVIAFAGDPEFNRLAANSTEERNEGLYLALLGMSLVGLLAVEQVFRNAKDDGRASIRLLCLGSGGIFVVNVFVYSQAALLGGLMPFFWEG